MDGWMDGSQGHQTLLIRAWQCVVTPRGLTHEQISPQCYATHAPTHSKSPCGQHRLSADESRHFAITPSSLIAHPTSLFLCGTTSSSTYSPFLLAFFLPFDSLVPLSVTVTQLDFPRPPPPPLPGQDRRYKNKAKTTRRHQAVNSFTHDGTEFDYFN